MRERSAGIRKRVHGVDDHFFRDPAHLDDAPRQRVEFLVVRSDGVVDHDFRPLDYISGYLSTDDRIVNSCHSEPLTRR